MGDACGSEKEMAADLAKRGYVVTQFKRWSCGHRGKIGHICGSCFECHVKQQKEERRQNAKKIRDGYHRIDTWQPIVGSMDLPG